jgi:hypothetical protein
VDGSLIPLVGVTKSVENSKGVLSEFGKGIIPLEIRFTLIYKEAPSVISVFTTYLQGALF